MGWTKPLTWAVMRGLRVRAVIMAMAPGKLHPEMPSMSAHSHGVLAGARSSPK